jgi:hypothetical protein
MVLPFPGFFHSWRGPSLPSMARGRPAVDMVVSRDGEPSVAGLSRSVFPAADVMGSAADPCGASVSAPRGWWSITGRRGGAASPAMSLAVHRPSPVSHRTHVWKHGILRYAFDIRFLGCDW